MKPILTKIKGIGRSYNTRSVTLPTAICMITEISVDDEVEIFVNSRKEIIIKKVAKWVAKENAN